VFLGAFTVTDVKPADAGADFDTDMFAYDLSYIGVHFVRLSRKLFFIELTL